MLKRWKWPILAAFLALGIGAALLLILHPAAPGKSRLMAGAPPAETKPQSGSSVAAQPASPAAPSSSATAPQRSPFEFLDTAKLLTERQTPPDSAGDFTRLRLVQTPMKYPNILVEDELTLNPANGTETLRARKAMVADQLIVKVAAGQTQAALEKINQQYGAKIIESLSPDTFLVQLAAPTLDAVTQAIAEYEKHASEIAYAEPNYLVEANATTPNDPSYNVLWGLHNTGQTGGTNDADIDAPEAWDLHRGSSTTIVGVIDTGIDYTHPDLAANIWTNTGEVAANGADDDGNGYIDDRRGWDFYNNDSDPADDQYHGTHVAGTIGAVGNNSQGVVGVSWTVSMMPLKFLSSSGSGYTSDAVRAVRYATGKGAHLTSNSWGGGGYSQSLKDAIDAAGQAGILFIAAAGNSARNIDSTPFYPASYTSANLICVAATDNRDQLASFSNYGSTGVDVAAPGVTIYSTLPNNRYGYLSGTSMATPHVSGAVALLISRSPGMTYAQIKDKILTTVDVKTSLNGRVATNGRINLNAILAGTNAAPQVNAGSNLAINQPASGWLDATVTDDGQPNPPGSVTVTWSKVSGPGTVTFANASAIDTSASFQYAGSYVLRLTASDGALSASDDVTVTVYGPNTAPTVSAGADVTGGSPLNLDGTVSDDGQPFTPGVVTVSWSKVSGPGTVTFGNAASADTSANFSATGTYVLRLTASDGSLTAFDEVQVVITALNAPPAVNAGADQAVGIWGSAYLDSTVTDDGLPAQPGTMTYQWSLVSGPGSVGFQSAVSADTTVSFSTTGIFVLRLTASDGVLSASDTVTVTVNASTKTPPPNTAPIVNAGADQRLGPGETARLDASMRDDGWPSPPGMLSAFWSKRSGPGTVTFSAASQPDTTASFGAPGVYVLAFTASDGAASSSDDVQITISAAPNQAPVAQADSAATDSNTAILIPVLANDSDPDGGPSALSISSVGSAGGGTAVVSGSQVRYTPASSFTGTDSFNYSITDGEATASAAVTVTVNPPPPNQPPVANNDSATTDEEVSVLVSVLANDSDPDNKPSPLSIASVGGAANGTTVVSGSQARYTPAAGFYGTDSFVYTVSDGSDTATATAQITVRNTARAQNLTSAGLTGVAVGAATGSSRILASGQWEIKGAGTGAGDDAFYFEQMSRSDSFEVVARVRSLSGGSAPQAGLMLREDNGATAKFAAIASGNASAYGASWRTSTGGAVGTATPAPTYSYPNAWVGIRRHGARAALYTSADGVNWTEDRVVQLTGISAAVRVGLFVSSGTAGVSARAVVTDFAVQSLIEPTVAAGASHSLAIKDDETAWSWGLNSTGQLGSGSTANRGSPGAVSGLSEARMVAAGGGHSLALKPNGTVAAWGSNSNGQLGDGGTTQRTSPVTIGLSGITGVAAGESHSMALHSNGTVWTWGSDLNGQLGDGPPPPTVPVKGVTPPPSTEKWSPIQVPGLSSVVAIAAGAQHSLALRSDGTVWAWGSNSSGQLGDGTAGSKDSPVQVNGLTGVIAIAAGRSHSMALKSDGTVWTWGGNAQGQLGDGTNTAQLRPVQVVGLAGVADISAGAAHCLALKDDGSVAAWGDNAQGQLGDGTTTPRSQPVIMTGVAQALAVAAGGQHSIVVLEDGSVLGTGSNAQGQLGIPGAAQRQTAAPIAGFRLL